MSSIERALRVDFVDGGRSRRCQVHLPPGYPNRNNLVKLIKEYGGDVQSHLAYADVVIVQDQIGKVEGMQKRMAATNRCRANLVVEPWLHDCIDRGIFISPELERYKPSCLNQRRSPGPSAAVTMGINQRRIRNDYTSRDEDAIVQVLAVWKGTILQAAELLSKMQEHTKQSFQTHLQANLEQGKFYNRRVEAFKRRQGEDGLQTIRDRLLEIDPNVAELLSSGVDATGEANQNAEDISTASPELQRRPSQLVDRSVQTVPRNDTPPEPDVTAPPQTHSTISPGTSITHTRPGTTVMRSNVNQGTVQSSTANISMTIIRRFLQEERDAFIKQLTLYLKSLYKDLPASQDGSVIGYLDSSQDVPEPPKELFEHMSTMIPNHTASEWKVHFSKPSNRGHYLDLAREELERILILEQTASEQEALDDDRLAGMEEEEGQESYDQSVDEMRSPSHDSLNVLSNRIIEEKRKSRDDGKAVIKEEYTVESLTNAQDENYSMVKAIPPFYPSRAGQLFFSSSQVDSEEEVDEMQDTQGTDAVNPQHTTSDEEIEDDEEEETIETEVEEDEIENTLEVAEDPEADLSLNGVSLGERLPASDAGTDGPINSHANDAINESEYVLADDDEDGSERHKIQVQHADVESSRRSKGTSESITIAAERTVIHLPSPSDFTSSPSPIASSSRSQCRPIAATSALPPIARRSNLPTSNRPLEKKREKRASYTTLATRMVPYVEIDNGNLRSPFNSIKSQCNDIRPLVINGYRRRRLSSSSIEEDEGRYGGVMESELEKRDGRGAARSEERSNKGTKIQERLHTIVTSALGPSSIPRRALKRLRLGSRPAKDRLDVLAEHYNIKREVVDGYFLAVKQDYDLLESILKVPR